MTVIIRERTITNEVILIVPGLIIIQLMMIIIGMTREMFRGSHKVPISGNNTEIITSLTIRTSIKRTGALNGHLRLK